MGEGKLFKHFPETLYSQDSLDKTCPLRTAKAPGLGD